MDPKRGLQDAELDQLADFMTEGCRCKDVAALEVVRQINRENVEILRGCILTPDGAVQVDDGGNVVRQ